MLVPKWDYRRVEGMLYRLAHPPDARPVQPSLRAGIVAPGPRLPMRETADRIDVTHAMSQLPQPDADMLREHYVLGVRRHGYRVRAEAVKRLLVVLDTAERAGDDSDQ